MRALYILVVVAGLNLPTFCYDDKIKPEPKQVSAPAKSVQDCRFLKEQDERLNCFNRFANSPTKKNTAQQKLKKPASGTMVPGPAKQ